MKTSQMNAGNNLANKRADQFTSQRVCWAKQTVSLGLRLKLRLSLSLLLLALPMTLPPIDSQANGSTKMEFRKPTKHVGSMPVKLNLIQRHLRNICRPFGAQLSSCQLCNEHFKLLTKRRVQQSTSSSRLWIAFGLLSVLAVSSTTRVYAANKDIDTSASATSTATATPIRRRPQSSSSLPLQTTDENANSIGVPRVEYELPSWFDYETYKSFYGKHKQRKLSSPLDDENHKRIYLRNALQVFEQRVLYRLGKTNSLSSIDEMSDWVSGQVVLECVRCN